MHRTADMYVGGDLDNALTDALFHSQSSIESLTINYAEEINIQQLQLLPALTHLCLKIESDWGAPWNDSMAMRQLLPLLWHYHYSPDDTQAISFYRTSTCWYGMD